MNSKTLRTAVIASIWTMALLAVMAFLFGDRFTPAAAAQEKLAAVSYLPIPAGTYNIDPAHTVIGFSVRHLEIAMVKGRFKDLTGSITFDDKDITRSAVEFSAKIESIDTGVAQRDAHLRTADFFDAAKFPSMSFKSTKVEKKGKGYAITGDLTIKGVTKTVTFPFSVAGAVKDPWGGTRFGVSASTSIDRREFGITYGTALPIGGFDIANEVAIDLQIEAVKAEPKAAN